MAFNLKPMREGRTRPTKNARQLFREGKPVENLLKPRSQSKWGKPMKGKLVKLDRRTVVIEREFTTAEERKKYIMTVRKLRQYCKKHPFEHAEFAPVNVTSVDGKGNRVWEQTVFAPSIDEVVMGFPKDAKKLKMMSPYKRLLLQKIIKHGVDPKVISGLAMKVVLDELPQLGRALMQNGMQVNLGSDFNHVLVRDYNPRTGKLIISIAGSITKPISIFDL